MTGMLGMPRDRANVSSPQQSIESRMWGPRATNDAAPVAPAPLIDPFQRAITYLRISVTDRCDFRCVYSC